MIKQITLKREIKYVRDNPRLGYGEVVDAIAVFWVVGLVNGKKPAVGKVLTCNDVNKLYKSRRRDGNLEINFQREKYGAEYGLEV